MVALAAKTPQEYQSVHRDSSRYIAHGGAAEMFASWAPRILYEGPAHTGKTRAVLEKCYLYATEIPNLRMLWVRKTRKSLSESVLTTWEEEVLPPKHHCIHGTAGKSNRETYRFNNGSVVVLGGMNEPDRIMSTQYDVIVYFEATEGDMDDWQKLITRNRNKRILLGTNAKTGKPVFFHQMIADCNPGSENHWLNRLADEGKMKRVIGRHSDNPFHDEDDQERLDSLMGATRRRLRDGEWCSEDGQVWECWDRATMMCNRQDLLVDPDRPGAGYRFEWTFASIDFGYRDPQVFQVWGVIDEVIHLVAEIYRREESDEWWGDKIAHMVQVWDPRTIVADSAYAAQIRTLNDRLGPLGGHNEDRLVVPVKKGPGSVLDGLRHVQAKMLAGQIKICHDALEEGACRKSLEKYRPTCTSLEIPAYVWKKAKDGSPERDAPEPTCQDHGCDAMRYAVVWKWGRDLSDEPSNTPEVGTIAAMVGHGDFLDSEGDDTDDFYPDWN